jgi:apolipoprotein N-acyltransferase
MSALPPTDRPIGPVPYLLAILAGGLLTLAFPTPGLWPLAFLGLTPLLLAMEGQGPGTAFLLGLAAGLTNCATLLYWLVNVLTFYGELPYLLAVPAFLLLILYLGAYMGLFTAGLALAQERFGLTAYSLGWCFTGAVLYTGLEHLKGRLLSGFPWEPLGAALVPSLPLIQFSDILGTSGLTLAVALVNLSAVTAIQNVALKRTRPALAHLAVILVVVGGLGAYGHFRLAEVNDRMDEAPQRLAAVVQGATEQSVKWDSLYRVSILRTYQALTLTAASRRPWLIVWPEAAVPFYFAREEGGTDWLKRLVYRMDTPLVFGAPGVEDTKEGRQYYNRVYLLDRRGETQGFYDKERLVPYGEYVPLKQLTPFIEKITQAAGDTSPGTRVRLLKVDGTRLGILICYESLFSNLARARVAEGADVLINPTNDAWFGASTALPQLLQQSILRAVENRRTMIRAANKGISAVIWPSGETRGRLGSRTAGILMGRVPLTRLNTVYATLGDVLAWICLGVTGLMFVAAIMIRRER